LHLAFPIAIGQTIQAEQATVDTAGLPYIEGKLTLLYVEQMQNKFATANLFYL
jgi:hypothetical protein